ncbi:MAG TPA: CsgG/HfaB family protein [Blastocatellia bacterium]|nr:CsgG/HfaB family protein [Blastocatellia bacterium]
MLDRSGIDRTGNFQLMACATATLCLLAFLPPATFGQKEVQPPWTGPKLRIAVMSISGTAFREYVKEDRDSRSTTIALPPPAEFALGLTEMLTTELVKTGRFIVVERASIKDVTGEQDFGASGRVNKETAAASGRVIGAQTLITGDITEFAYNQTSIGGTFKPIKILKAKSDRVTAMVALDIRLVDAVTSEVIFSQRAEGKASMTGASAELTRRDQEFSVSGFKNTPLGHASREAIENAVAAIVSGMKAVPWSGRVIDVREGLVYINAGSEQGIRPGMEFDVYHQQPPLVDPETGKTLGTPDRKVGTLRVTTVEEKYSVAEITSGSGLARNHLVRFRGQPQKP